MKTIKVRSRIKAPPLRLAFATAKAPAVAVRKNGIEVPFVTDTGDELTLPLPDGIDPDTSLGQQLSAFLGKEISDALDLSDFEGKTAFLVLAAKRGSGGKFHHSIEALLAPSLVIEAAAANTPKLLDKPDPAT